MTLKWKYALAGLLLGLGAPLGALLLRVALFADVRADPRGDLELHRFFYAYSLAGSCVVLAIAGYLAGLRARALEQAKEFYHRLAEHDSATGLLNYRAFMERYRRVIERAVKLKQPIALLLIDVDHLKKINDRHGHDQGNAALQHVAAAIRTASRTTDESARWGGDEFTVLMDGADETAARRTAEAIMAWLDDNPLRYPVTVTIGIEAGVPRTNRDDYFARADQALYEGKHGGRNQIRVAAPNADSSSGSGRVP
jgi:diguanylate cyclase (GGDEF)-like protein